MPLRFTTKQIIKTFALSAINRFFPTTVATADLNRDGNLDLITNGIDVCLGDGKGNFAITDRSIDLPQTRYAADLQVADLNRDGNLDVVSVSDQTITTLFGDGSGGFRSSQTSASAGYPQSLALADFDGDGDLDALTVHSNYYQSDSPKIEAVLLAQGNGDGSFSQPTTVFSVNQVKSAATADFNGDGRIDLAVTSSAKSKGIQPQQQLTILLNNGTKQFKTGKSIHLGEASFSRLLAADFNGDGKADLAVAADNRVTVCLNKNGDLKPQYRGTIGEINQLLAADLNNDGKLDLVTTSGDVGVVNVDVLFGDGRGHFSAYAQPFSASVSYDHSEESNGYDIVTGDFNGDGKLDLATADGASYTEGTMTLFLNSSSFPAAAIVVSDYAVDGSSVRQGGMIVDLSKRQLRLTAQPQVHTPLKRFVTDVIGTRDADQLRGNNFSFNNRSNILNGMTGNDVILGLGGNDQILGGAGDDRLTGGTGRDQFVFSGTPNYPVGLNQPFQQASLGIDQIQDFETGKDKIILDRGTFTALDRQVSFASVDTSSAAAISNALITYIRSNGKLYYNENGAEAGFGSGGLFAVLVNRAALSRESFSIGAGISA